MIDTMCEYIGLDSLQSGEWGIVRQINCRGGIRKRFFDIGLTENTAVKCVGVSPMGDPKAYLIRGTTMAIRNKDGGTVLIERKGRGTEPYG